MVPENESLTYKDAGVDIDAGNALVERIKPAVARTRRPEVLAGLGGFGALFELPMDRYRRPVLVSATDGVGTKLKLALELGKHDSVGIDLVAMCVNDLVVQGAEPLFFLDYYASGRLEVDVAADVVRGIARGCELAGAALVGGETAEMPGMYHPGEYDLAGFCVGVVEKEAIIDGRQVRSGDVLIGLASSGPHSNGYSLIRKILQRSGADLATHFANDSQNCTLGEVLLEPTRIYVKPLLKLFGDAKIQGGVHGLAHITGGGLLENLPRVLPANTRAVIETGAWPRPAIFDWLQVQGQLREEEMLRTFNCGVGMVLCIAEEQAQPALALLRDQGETAWLLGNVEPGQGKPTVDMG